MVLTPSAARASEARREHETLPTALWLIPVADLGGVARHMLDVARTGLPGWRLVVLCPEGPLAERLHSLGTAVVTGEFGPHTGAHASLVTLRRVLARLRPQLVHAHLAFADIVAAAALAADRRTALVTTEHGIADDDLVYHGSALKSRARAELHAQRLKRADAIIAVSGATRDAMIRKWHPYRAIDVIPNGVDAPVSSALADARSARPADEALAGARSARPADEALAGARSARPADEALAGARSARPADEALAGARSARPADEALAGARSADEAERAASLLPAERAQRDEANARPARVLSLSRLAPEKRIDQLLRAFAIVRATRPDASLTIAGTGPLEPDLRTLAVELGITDVVEFPGFVDPAAALRSADIVAQLSVWENCSYTLLDAIAQGVGVVASRVGGNPELLDDAFLVDADDPAAVAERIIAQLENPAMRPTLAPDWPTVADMCARTVEVYERAATRRASAPTASVAASANPAAAPRDEIVIATNNGDIGGGEIMLLAIAEALRELGEPVRVVGPSDPDAVVARARDAGFAVTELRASGRRAYMLALRRWTQRGEYALLWCNGLVPSAATAGLPRRIVHLHKTADGAAQQALARAARRGALVTLVPSRFMAGEFVGARVLENWTRDHGDVRANREPRASGPARIGVLGRVSRLKGVDVLAAATERLLAEGHDMRLLVAGEPTFVEPKDLAPVEAAIDRLGDRAERLGAVDSSAFLADVDLLVVPSIVGESFGLVAAEAMAAGVPVAVSDAGALPEVVGPEHPWVFRAGNVADAARVIGEALDALPANEELSRARERWAANYSLAAGRERVADELRRLGVRV